MMRIFPLLLSALIAFQASASPMVLHDAGAMVHYLERTESLWRESAALRGRDNHALKETLKAGKSALKSGVKSVLHGAETALVILMISYTEAVLHQRQIKLARGQELSFKEMSEIAAVTADQMINSFDMMSSFAMGTVTGAVMSQMNRLVKVPASRGILRKLLRSGSLSVLTFMGWEAGSQLWNEGINALDTQQEVETALSLRFTEIMSGGGTPEQLRVYEKVKTNMWNILTLQDPERGRLWVYNTWRSRVATGDFVTLVTSMTIAGMGVGALAGTLAAPGPGTFVGVIFGLGVGLASGVVGGILILTVPDWMKDSATFQFKQLRINANYTGISTSEFDFRHIAHAYQMNHDREPTDNAYLNEKSEFAKNFLLDKWQKTLADRRSTREAIMTIHFERYYNALLKLQDAEYMLLLVQSSLKRYSNKFQDTRLSTAPKKSQENLLTLLEQYKEEVATASRETDKVEKDLLNFYPQEVRRLDKFIAKNDLHADLIMSLQGERAELENQTVNIGLIIAGINPRVMAQMKSSLSVEEQQQLPMAAQLHLNSVEMYGFLESKLL